MSPTTSTAAAATTGATATLDRRARPLDFAGASVVLSGGDRGIGRAVAAAFARAGADVLIVSDVEAVHDAAAELDAAGRGDGEDGAGRGVRDAGHRPAGRVRGAVADVTDPDALERALASVRTVDVLVSNAGIELPTALDDSGDDVRATFRRVIDVNLVGCENLVRAALPRLADGGRVLVTSSIWGKTSVAGFSAYAASKHALIGLARTWARELGARGITVNAVSPGFVEADMTDVLPEAQKEKLRGEIALGRLGKPEDIADVVAFLASDDARWLTGENITASGGIR